VSQTENYFEILGIPLDAGFDVIERGYRQARKDHAENPTRLKLIEKAYRTLINPFTKEAYLKQLHKSQGRPGGSQPPVEEQRPTQTRHGTSISGVENPTDEPGAISGQKASGGGRSKTQVFGAGAATGGRTPEPKPSTPSPAKNRTPEPMPEPPTSKGRSKTQVIGGGAAPSSRTPEPQPSAPKKSAGRSKTQVVGVNQSPARAEPGEPAVPGAKSSPGGRQKTQVMGEESTIPTAAPAKPGAARNKTEVMGPEDQPQGSPRRKQTGMLSDVPPSAAKGRGETGPLPGEIPLAQLVAEAGWEVVVLFRGQSTIFALKTGENLVGRPSKTSEAPQVPLEDPQQFISRTQATILVEGGQVSLRDNGSRNGTTLNGVRLTAGEFVPFRPGDTVMIEEREIHIRIKGEK